MYNYQENSAQQAAEREKAVYDKLLNQYHQLLFAITEGIYEVSVRSQGGVITVPVDFSDGIQIGHTLLEAFSERVDKVEHNLNDTISEVGAEAKAGLKKQAAAAEEFEASFARNREIVAQHNKAAALAEQAAATATPAQKGPGRPKKPATPKPEVMEAVGAIAAQVPMNGSTANAAARATGSTPQG